MAQFDVYLLRDGTYVVDVQSPIASVHRTRLVIPLASDDDDAAVVTRLNPLVMLNGEPWLLATHFIAAIEAGLLNGAIGSLAHEEWTIKSAIDFIVNGF